MASKSKRRSGAGRPVGAIGITGLAEIEAEVSRAVKSGLTPLEYMLQVMRNPEADQTRRDRMAQAAAPYCHRRVSDEKLGKKEAAAQAAETAGQGSDWAGDLDADRPN